MVNPVPRNDTTRLVIYAVMFLAVLGGTVTLVALGKMDAASGLQWLISGASLIGTGLGGPNSPKTSALAGRMVRPHEPAAPGRLTSTAATGS